MNETFDLEGAPDDGQKDRLEDFLSELAQLSRRYRIGLVDGHETLEFIDLVNQHIIGLGLAHELVDGRVRGYLPADSILDGIWLVDSDDGPVEQRHVGNVFPLRNVP